MENGSSQIPENQHVVIYRRGQYIEIIPPVPELYERFQTVQHLAKATKSKGFLVEEEPFVLVWEMRDRFNKEFMQSFAGLEKPIKQFLEERGYQIELTGQRPDSLPEPNWEKLSSNRASDRRMLRFVQQNERGVIAYRKNEVEVESLIAQIALVWPEESIVVIVTRQRDAKTLFNKLKRRGLYQVSVATTHKKPAIGKRIVIATDNALKQNEICTESRSICICLNPTETVNRKDWPLQITGRLYALHDDVLALSKQQVDFMDMFFGQEWLYIPKHDFLQLVPEVYFMEYKGGYTAKDGIPLCKLKREAVWRNDKRNRLISGLAKAIAYDDFRAIGAKYPSVSKPLLPKVSERVVVLVENLEHAARLLKFLKGWPIVAGSVADINAHGSQVQYALTEGKKPESAVYSDIIITSSALQQINCDGVLIRADAGIGLPPFSRKRLTVGDRVPSSFTIIDLTDRHHPYFRKQSQHRKEEYLDQGWVVNGESKNSSERREFLFATTKPNRTTVMLLPYSRQQSPKIDTAYDYYLYRKEKRDQKSGKSPNVITLKQIADHEYLLYCFQELRRYGGLGPGKDEISYFDISTSDCAKVFRKLSESLLRGHYRPQFPRKVSIPKPGTDEKRTLKINSIFDRSVSMALHKTLAPQLDKLFLEGSYGNRTNRSPWKMLAQLKKTVEEKGRWVLIIEDIRKAFDNVKVKDIIKTHQQAQLELKEKHGIKINDSVVNLISTIAKGVTQKRKKGIDQGSNYSPQSLNVLLHYIHDVPLNAEVAFPLWYRYVDNLTYLCESVSEGQRVLIKVQQILNSASLKLKGEDGIVDLRKTTSSLLGFKLRRSNNQLIYLIAPRSWENLTEQLAHAHKTVDPATRCREVIVGWLNAMGPALENDGDIVAKVCGIAALQGFQELDPTLLETTVTQAQERWVKLLRDIKYSSV